MNPDMPLETFLPPPEFSDIHMLLTKDWNGMNNGVFPIRVHPWAVELLSAAIAYPVVRPDVELFWPDQSALANLLQENEYFSRSVVYCPLRWFNAYMRQPNGEGLNPDSPAYLQVHPGDLLVHFPGTPRDKLTETLEPYLAIAERHRPEWELPLERTGDLPPAIYAGCTSPFPSSSSTIVLARAAENNQATQVHGPIIMWAQPVTVQFQSSDLSLFVTPTTISTTSKSDSVPVQTTTTSTALATPNTSQIPSATQPTELNHVISSTGLSAGAKAGIGVGVGVGGVAIFALLFFVFRYLRKARSMRAASKGQYYHNTEALGGLVPPAGSNSQQGPPSELDNAESNSRKYLPELQG
ncbi:hypothetical protein CNMCM8980_006281 [Aspergillus fumigatiaffinis]|nr:hypothetical protein CNMCM8980_006281 [Aspergillus fumigatiaffinis]